MTAGEPSNGGLSGCDCGAFLLDVTGKFRRGDLDVRASDSRRRSCEKIDQSIDKAWADQCRRAQRDGVHLYNGRLCRLVECVEKDARLCLTLGEVSFREFVGTNLLNPRLRHLHGQDVLADPLGVSAAVATADGRLLLGRRSKSVFFHADRIHPIGGMVEMGEGGADAALPSPFRTMRGELYQELGIQGDDVSDPLWCIGLVRDKAIWQPELIFDVRLKLNLRELRIAHEAASDAGEHTELVFLSDDSGAVVSFLQDRDPELTPVAKATLLLHGLRAWGTGWFMATRGYLRSLV